MGACSAADGGAASPGPGRISENIPDPVFDPVPDPEQSSGGGFPNGGQEDGRVGQHLWCSGSRHAFQASDPGSNPGRAIFGNFVEPTRGPVFCRGTRFPNGFSIRKSIRKSDPVL